MIDTVLIFLRDQVNEHLRIKTGDTSDKLSPINLMTVDGTTDHLPANTLLLTVVRMEEEKLAKTAPPYIEKVENNYFGFNPEINLNLYLLFSAHFGGQSDQYIESLKLLSYVIGFFQTNPFFDQKNSPQLNKEIERITLELISPSFETENQLWGMLGAKYMPSVLYKLRLVSIREEQIQEKVKIVEELSVQLDA